MWRDIFALSMTHSFFGAGLSITIYRDFCIFSKKFHKFSYYHIEHESTHKTTVSCM